MSKIINNIYDIVDKQTVCNLLGSLIRENNFDKTIWEEVVQKLFNDLENQSNLFKVIFNDIHN